MMCPVLSPDVLETGEINLRDQIGNALLCTWGRKLLLILPEDTTPSPL